jgi:hypothetical protein
METSISLYWVVSASDIGKDIWEHVCQVMSAGDIEMDIQEQVVIIVTIQHSTFAQLLDLLYLLVHGYMFRLTAIFRPI